MKKIIRVFPRKTSYSPNDELCFFGPPPMPWMIPDHDEVHVSCTFTWDVEEAKELAFQWEVATQKPVKLGGPAFKSPAPDFVQGLYMKPNIIFTTRGCNNKCPWCFVPSLEGRLRELDSIPEGNIIQDNNFLQANRAHREKVFEMLKTQKAVAFRGGLEPDLIDDHFVDGIRGLKIRELWLACDTDERLPLFRSGCEKLVRAGFSRDIIRCYVLSYAKDLGADEARARAVWEAGATPFVQLYQPGGDVRVEYDKKWKQFQRDWSRPAIIKARMKLGMGGIT